MYIKRREFLALLGGTAGALSLGDLWGCGGGGATSITSTPAPPVAQGTGDSGIPQLPAPTQSGIDHIIVIMMENRSFDHLLGWLPGADGVQAGAVYTDRNGQPVPTWRLGTDDRGCGYTDPAHLYDDCRVDYNDGKMDGFLRAGANDKFTVAYYAEGDLPFHASLARNYTTCSRYFSSFLGPTTPNRLFLHSAQTDRLSNDGPNPCTLPTIWDRLAEAGVSATYYYSNYNFLDIYGGKYDSIKAPTAQFFTDVAAGTLPSVTFLEPGWSIDGDNEDQHPHANIMRGEHFLGKVYEAVSGGPKWGSTALIVTYDEDGGFYEHVVPPRVAPGNDIDTDMVDGKVLLGFRVPTMIISPFSKGDPAAPRISKVVFDHTSILKLIQWRWGLKPLSGRDTSGDVGNLAYALDFTAKSSIAAPALVTPPEPIAAPAECP